jgi:hypothetical protein
MTARFVFLRRRATAIGVALAVQAASSMAAAAAVADTGLAQDPPARAGRIAWLAGPVSLSPSGADAWAQAPLNRPLVAGDRLWTDAGGRDEAQFGPVVARMDAGTLLSVLAADEGATQLQVSQGRIDLHVRRIDPNAVVEIDTPNLAFVARAPGDYRIVVSPDGASTDVAVLRGGGDVYGDGNAYSIGPGQGYRFAAQDLQNLGNAPVQPYDDFDRWAFARDERLDRAQSARFVAPDVVGYEDLDDNGAWRVVPDYGTVWVPTRVAADWAPYHSGHWAWVDPWGWTWVDDQPWGYAVSHYGRWVNLENRWAWVPTPARERPVFAPAVVAFVGAALALGGRGDGPGVGWFPLGPHESYRPPYHASPAYLTRINVGMDRPERIRYVNRGVSGALMAMPAAQFAGAMPAQRFGRAFDARTALSAPLVMAPNARPLPQSRFGTALSRQLPPEGAQRRLAVARSLPAGFGHPGGPRFAQGGAPGGRPDFGPGAAVPVRMLRPAGPLKPGVPPMHAAAGPQFAGRPETGPGRSGPPQQGLMAQQGHGPAGAPARMAPAGAPYQGRGAGVEGQHWAETPGAPGAPGAHAPAREAGPMAQHGFMPRAGGQGAPGQGAMPHTEPGREQAMHLRAPQKAAMGHAQREAHAEPQSRPAPVERARFAEGAHVAPRPEMHAQPQRDMSQPQPHHDAAPAFQAHREMTQPQRHEAPPQQRHDAPQQHHDAPPQQHHDEPQQHHDAPPQQHQEAPHPQPAPPPQHQGGDGGGHGHEHEHGHEHGH